MKQKQSTEDLSQYKVWGLTLLQLMSLLFIAGIVLHTVLNLIF